MTDKVLLPAAFGGTTPADDVALIPGWGVIPGAEARAHVADLLDSETPTWLRRLFTDPTGRDLVALDSRRRLFQGGLRTFLELRDPTCRVPWCDAPTGEADHVQPVHDGGPTSGANAAGLCQRHNQVKEEVGWHFTVRSTGLDGTGPHGIRIHTPTGRVHDSTAPPILGQGWPAPLPVPVPVPVPVPDEWWTDTEFHEMPLPEDPWGGWIPDPDDDFGLDAEIIWAA